MVLKISAPCVSDGSGNPFFFVGTCLWGVQDLAMERKKIATDSAVFLYWISFGKKTRPKYYSTFKSITYFPFKSLKLISVELEG